MAQINEKIKRLINGTKRGTSSEKKIQPRLPKFEHVLTDKMHVTFHVTF